MDCAVRVFDGGYVLVVEDAMLDADVVVYAAAVQVGVAGDVDALAQDAWRLR